MRLLVPCLLFVSTCFGQTPKPLRYATEVGRYASSSGQNPFWLRTNQFGIVPLDQSVLTVRQALRVDYHDAPKTKRDSVQALNRRIDWSWGAEAVLNAGSRVQLLIPEAYVKVRLGPTELWGGRRRDIIGLVDTTLTSGSYTLSGNALPLLKFQVAIPQFWPRKGLLAIKGLFSHE